MAINVQSDIKKVGPEKPGLPIKKQDDNQKIEKPRKKRCGSFLSSLVSIAIIAVIILAILYGVSLYTSWNVFGLPKAKTDWQAVFLTNGQVYFGHMQKECMGAVVLEDIYYLQVSNPLQQSSDQGAGPQQQRMGELSLVKLGNELHGPVDEMRINKDHVLFVEDLKIDGKVVEAILQHKESSKTE